MPSARLVSPSFELVTPLPPVGVPFVVAGGQAEAQAPLQVLFVPVSLANT